jgi:hypothetical protein
MLGKDSTEAVFQVKSKRKGEPNGKWKVENGQCKIRSRWWASRSKLKNRRLDGFLWFSACQNNFLQAIHCSVTEYLALSAASMSTA